MITHFNNNNDSSTQHSGRGDTMPFPSTPAPQQQGRGLSAMRMSPSNSSISTPSSFLSSPVFTPTQTPTANAFDDANMMPPRRQLFFPAAHHDHDCLRSDDANNGHHHPSPQKKTRGVGGGAGMTMKNATDDVDDDDQQECPSWMEPYHDARSAFNAFPHTASSSSVASEERMFQRLAVPDLQDLDDDDDDETMDGDGDDEEDCDDHAKATLSAKTYSSSALSGHSPSDAHLMNLPKRITLKMRSSSSKLNGRYAGHDSVARRLFL